MPLRSLSRKLGLSCLVGVIVALGGCGGDGGGDVIERPFAVPKARETPDAVIADLRSIVRAKSCRRLAARWHSANGQLTDEICHNLFTRLGTEITQIVPRPHGTGLAVSFKSPTGVGRRSAVFALDTDGRWRLLLVADIDRGPIEPFATVDRDLRRLIRAIATTDCPTIYRLSHHVIGMAANAGGSIDRACNQVTSSNFAAALAVYPQRKPQYLGRGRNFTFYALDLAEVGYFTILMARSPLGAAPGKPVTQRFVAAVQAR
jgi:hypothetical protein